MKTRYAKSAKALAAAGLLMFGAVVPVYGEEYRTHRPADGMFCGKPIPNWNSEMCSHSLKLKPDQVKAGCFYIRMLYFMLFKKDYVLVYVEDIYERKVENEIHKIASCRTPEFGYPDSEELDLNYVRLYPIPEF